VAQKQLERCRLPLQSHSRRRICLAPDSLFASPASPPLLAAVVYMI
jgi:hypothetical protein